MAEAESSRATDEALEGKKKKKGSTLKAIRRFFRKDSKKPKTDDDKGVRKSMSAESVFDQKKKETKNPAPKKDFMKSMEAILQKDPRGGRPLSFTSEQNLTTNTDDDDDMEEENTQQFFQSSWSMHQLNLPTTAGTSLDLDAVPTTSHVNLKLQHDKLGIRQKGKRQSKTHGQKRTASPGGIAQSLQILPQVSEEPNVNRRSKELRLYDPKASKRLSLGKEVEFDVPPASEVKVTETPVAVETKPEEPKEKLDKRRSASPENSDVDSKFGDRPKRRSMVEEKVEEQEEEEEEEEKTEEQEEEKDPGEVTEFERMVSRFKKSAKQKKTETGKKAAELETQKVVLRKNSKSKQNEEIAQKRSSVQEIDLTKKTTTPKRSQSMAMHTTPPNIQVFKRDSPKVKDRERSRTLPEQRDSVSDDKKNRVSLKEVEEEKGQKEEMKEKKEEIIVKKQEMRIQKDVVVKKVEVKPEPVKEESKKIESKTQPAKKIELKTEPAKKIEPKAEPAKKIELKAEPAKKIELKAKAEPAKKIELKAEPAKKIELNAEPAKKVELKAEPAKKVELKAEPAKKIELETEPAKKIELKTEAAKTESKKTEVKTEPPKTVETKSSEKEEKIEEKKVEITIKKEIPKSETSKNVQTQKTVQIKDSEPKAPFKVKTLDTECSWMTLARKKRQNWNTEGGEESSEKEVSLQKSAVEEKAMKRKSVFDMVKNMEQSKVS